jgi:8-oxo-dGTP pyrophosphatase MutT (NUDIX family)
MDPQLKKKLSALTGDMIKGCLRARRPSRVKEPGLRPASVLVPLIFHEQGWRLLFTKRTDQVKAHKGEISFPGGMIEPGESARAAALRETDEELGIKEESIHILGELDEILTFTGFRIRPFVASLAWPTPVRPNPGEIDCLYLLPLDGFADLSRFKAETWKRNDLDYPVYFYRFSECTVWGATAKITKNFIERLGLECRPQG